MFITFSQPRTIGDVVVDCAIEETHTDRLTVTEHPVERGANKADHAYKQPAEVVIRAGWSNSSPQAEGDPGYVQDVYDMLLDLQASLQPFEITTGKRLYDSMLILSLGVTTDQTTEQALMVTATCRELLLVDTTTTTTAPTQDQADPSKTGETIDAGTKSLQSI
jgi:hypothetical protein